MKIGQTQPTNTLSRIPALPASFPTFGSQSQRGDGAQSMPLGKGSPFAKAYAMPRFGISVADVQFDVDAATRLDEVLSFDEYLGRLGDNPNIARTIHQRTYDMIMKDGMDETYHLDQRVRSYKFFTEPPTGDGLIGVERPIDEFVQHLHQAAKGTQVGKKLILFVGGPGSGKSTLVRLITNGMERYSATDEGAMYSLRWEGIPEEVQESLKLNGDSYDDPIRIDPLALLPESSRKELAGELNAARGDDTTYKLHLAGANRKDLSILPGSSKRLCKALLDYEIDKEGKDGAYQRVLSKYAKAKRVAISKTDRVGVGKFEARDPKALDSTQLTGNTHLIKALKYDSESNPFGFDYESGALFAANRGIMELVEALKLEKDFLYLLLSLNEERTVTPDKQQEVPVDELVFAHTNVPEYDEKRGDSELDAVFRRMKVIKMPYNTRLNNEITIYENDIMPHAEREGITVAPHTLRTAAMASLITRMTEADNQRFEDPVYKIRALNGEISENDVSTRELRELVEEGVRNDEGMAGASPREMQGILPAILTHPDITEFQSIDGYGLLKLIERKLDAGDIEIDDEIKAAFYDALPLAREDLDQHTHEDVLEAVAADPDHLTELFDGYLRNVEAYATDTEVYDTVRGVTKEPSEKLMRDIERHMEISQSNAPAFRRRLNGTLGSRHRQEQPIDIESFPDIKRAIVKHALDQVKDMINWDALCSTKPLSGKQADQRTQVIGNLMKMGYSEESARHALAKVGELRNR